MSRSHELPKETKELVRNVHAKFGDVRGFYRSHVHELRMHLMHASEEATKLREVMLAGQGEGELRPPWITKDADRGLYAVVPTNMADLGLTRDDLKELSDTFQPTETPPALREIDEGFSRLLECCRLVTELRAEMERNTKMMAFLADEVDPTKKGSRAQVDTVTAMVSSVAGVEISKVQRLLDEDKAGPREPGGLARQVRSRLKSSGLDTSFLQTLARQLKKKITSKNQRRRLKAT